MPKNGTGIGANGANVIVGTPRPSYPISDEVAVFVDSPVGGDDDEQPNEEFASQCKAKGKGRCTEPATISLHVRVRFLFDLVSYCDVRIQSNPFIMKETSV